MRVKHRMAREQNLKEKKKKEGKLGRVKKTGIHNTVLFMPARMLCPHPESYRPDDSFSSTLCLRMYHLWEGGEHLGVYC